MHMLAGNRLSEYWSSVRTLTWWRHPRDYAEQTYASPFRIVRFPHRRRYELATRFIRAAMPGTVLDYGAGDGHLIVELAAMGEPRPLRITLYEPVSSFAQLAHAAASKTDLVSVTEVVETPDLGQRRFDVIVCLGVLEHMPLPERERFYRICADHLSPRGMCLIDVPIEVGPTLLIKEGVRVVLKARTAEYSATELIRHGVGSVQFDPARFAGDSTETWIHYHTGFDYRLLRAELAARFDIVHEYNTPFARLPPWLMNQEIFFVVRSR